MKVDLKILGLFSLKTEDLKFWQLLILVLIGVIIGLAALYWLRFYALSVLGAKGIIKIISQLFNSRSP
jgi:uncharacterized membrane protein HdeD (DUF308 family)